MASHARKIPATEPRRCSVCGDRFVSVQASSGRWARTCSVECQIAAIDRFIGALSKRRDALAAGRAS